MWSMEGDPGRVWHGPSTFPIVKQVIKREIHQSAGCLPISTTPGPENFNKPLPTTEFIALRPFGDRLVPHLPVVKIQAL